MAERLKYRDTGFEYVKGSENVIFSNGIVLKLEEFKELDKHKAVVLTILQMAKDGAPLYDFEYAAKEGTLRQLKGPTLALPPVKKQKKKPPIPENAYESILEQKEAPISTNALFDEPKSNYEPKTTRVPLIVQSVMILVAVGSAIMSSYHTTMFIWTSGRPMWIALATGIIMIFFSATAFTAARYFLQEKNASMIFGAIFIVLGLGVVAYSMFATLAVNYDQFQWEERQEHVVIIQSTTEAEIEAQRRFVLQSEADRLDQEIERLSAEVYHWRTRSWQRHDEVAADLRELVRDRGELTLAIIDAGSRQVAAQGVVAAERITIFVFVSELFGFAEDLMRFFVLTIPALFYDIAAPFGFTIILLLEDRRRKNVEQTAFRN